MRLPLTIVLLLIVVTSLLSSSITDWIVQKRIANAASIKLALQVETAQRAEADAKIRSRNQVWKIYFAMINAWQVLPEQATLDDVVRALRANAQTMSRIDLKDCPAELIVDLQYAAQSMVGYSNYWARSQLLSEGLAKRSIAIPTASTYTGGVMLPIPDLDAVKVLGGSVWAREEDAEATRQFTDAFVRLGKTMRRFGAVICGTG